MQMHFYDNIEFWLRTGVFVVLLISLLSFESIWPRRRRIQIRLARWRTNFGFSVINAIIVRLMGPVTALAVATIAAQKQWGIFNLLDLPIWAEFIAALLILDLAIYAQHVVTHKVPLLWRLHKVHHTDRDFDMSTALRFHPVEIALSMLYKCLLVLIIGPGVFAVLVFETVLNGSAMFNHSNLKLPLWLDKVLRLLIVTPDMHRVHHSINPGETNRNFGFCLPYWDWLFGTYKSQPDAGHLDMVIGLPEHQTPEPSKLLWALKLPFR